jgi:biotin transport system substrate-specific component
MNNDKTGGQGQAGPGRAGNQARPPAAPDVPAPVSLDEMRRLTRLVLWAALIGAGGWLNIPLAWAPISLQTFFVILAGLIEGPRLGAMAAGLYLLAGLLGLPVFTGGVGGPAIIFRPSAGFALAFPLGAALAGLGSSRFRGKFSFGRAFAMAVLGSLAILALGFVGLLVNTGLSPAAAGLTLLTFVPGDLAKSGAAASIASARLFSRRRRT